MTRDLGVELDELKNEVKELAASVKTLIFGSSANSSVQDKTHDKASRGKVLQLQQPNSSGHVSYFGFFEAPEVKAGNNSYYWDMNRSAEQLLNMDDQQVARVLATIGNKQRLMLLKSILREPATASELVERLDMGTTGQVYHHLRTLQASDLVEQDKGVYFFKGHRTQALIMLLAGVADALDTRYSAGVWDEASTEQ